MWLGIKPLDRVKLEVIYSKVNHKPLVDLMRQRQLSWVGHALRRNEHEPAKMFALYNYYEREAHQKEVGKQQATLTIFVV